MIQTHELVSDNTYQNDSKIVPDHLGEIRLSDTMEIAPNHFPTGLYVYNLTYTEVIEHTDEATEDFYFMGQQNINQREGEYVLMFGVDSKFAESIVVKLVSSNLEYELPVENGCAVLQTSDIPFNTETMMEIKVSSNDESFTYKRALVHAGDPQGEYRQQFLIIDRDFDGIEDLYDGEVSESEIQESYAAYRELYPLDSNSSNDDSLTDSNAEDLNNENGDPGQFTNLGKGWSNVSWFGTLFDTSTGWSYHSNLKWIYPVFDSSGSLWFWQEKLGWCWTAENIFPYVFPYQNYWIYLEYSDPKNLRYYDFVLKKRIGF